MNMKKKVLFAISSAAVVAALAFGATAAASAATLREIRNTAAACVPDTAEMISTEENGSKYEICFYDREEGRTYEVEVSRRTRTVKKIETELEDDSGAQEVLLSYEEAEALVKDLYASAEIKSIELMRDDGLYEYDISFEAADCYGSVALHAGNGTVLESKIRMGAPVVIPVSSGAQQGVQDAGSFLTMEAASQAVLEIVPDGNVTDIDFDRDDGRYVFEAEVYKDGYEYDVVIDAVSGEKISSARRAQGKAPTEKTPVTDEKAANRDNAAQASGQDADYIGVAKAKETALEHAGLTAADVVSVRAELKVESGIARYDVSFETDEAIYRYKIHAVTAAVLSDSREKKSGESVPVDYIGVAAAKTAALKHAGVKESSASFTKAKLDADDDGDAVYDIEFYTASTHYDYEVNAVSGNIVSAQQKPKNTAPADQVIGEEKAKQIALEHAGVSASKAAFTKVKLDWDDGKQVYEIEFYQKNQEYDYEIDALTGKVLEFDHDAESYTPPKDEQDVIGTEKARSIVLKKAGNGAEIVKIKLSYDDGKAYYEGEARTTEAKYEFELDGVTGTIVEWETEKRDKPASGGQEGAYIGQTKARSIVLAKIGGDDARIVELELDRDDGKVVYEGEARDARNEYEFEIDAYTGVILSWETDDLDD